MTRRGCVRNNISGRTLGSIPAWFMDCPAPGPAVDYFTGIAAGIGLSDPHGIIGRTTSSRRNATGSGKRRSLQLSSNNFSLPPVSSPVDRCTSQKQGSATEETVHVQDLIRRRRARVMTRAVKEIHQTVFLPVGKKFTWNPPSG